VLDQGFYPDGVWTAPGDEALRRDIELSKAVGFNGARLHQKVFEPRYLYWADKLGYLVWGEYPSYGANYGNAVVNIPISQEWIEVLTRDRNHPSIIGWCPFNETTSLAGKLQNEVVAATRAIDPTRPVLDTSGYTHSLPDPDILDAHDYDQNPETFGRRYRSRLGVPRLPSQYGGLAADIPYFVSEYGGIGWIEGEAKQGWGYGRNPKTLEEFYARYEGLTNGLLENRNLFGFCYTQLTDVEQERNGLYFYDRRPKFDVEKIRAINSRQAAYEKDPPKEAAESPRWRVLVGAFPDADVAHEWRYSTDAPAANWAEQGFDDSSWPTGKGGFGRKDGWKSRTGTVWTGKDIWLRQEFQYEGLAFDLASLVIHYDNSSEVYINGKKIWEGQGWNDDYDRFEVTTEARAALKSGKNLIAVHCHQEEGGQFIDVALLLGDKSNR